MNNNGKNHEKITMIFAKIIKTIIMVKMMKISTIVVKMIEITLMMSRIIKITDKMV